MMNPNILYIMTDQQRFDTIAALGNRDIHTPNMDRLANRGISFTNAYSTCPVCIPARYTIRTGCEPPTTRYFSNEPCQPRPGQSPHMTGRCGPYLAQRMREHGYRTFGIGKFHTTPWDEDLGYDVHLHSEELHEDADQRRRDAYAAWIRSHHPQFDYIEGLMGERTEMYYMPQASPLPAELTVESWAADRAVEQIGADGQRPFFGFVSFIGPHPPFAPPIPYNRMYNPERMPGPVSGSVDLDHMDEQIPWMNRLVWAEAIDDLHARILKARYYGEITYIDHCLGKILDAVDALPRADNTLICFFSDHGDHLGDHHAWQKESFFESSCHIPFLLSWPVQIEAAKKREEFICLTDLFGIATGAAGFPECREGADILSMLKKEAPPRESVTGLYGEPGTAQFKIMLRTGKWKYLFFANGGGEQLFDMENDPHELVNAMETHPDTGSRMREAAVAVCTSRGLNDALSETDFRTFPRTVRTAGRIHQFDLSRGVTGFPENPADVFANMQNAT